jgi:hypothetical protein
VRVRLLRNVKGTHRGSNKKVLRTLVSHSTDVGCISKENFKMTTHTFNWLKYVGVTFEELLLLCEALALYPSNTPKTVDLLEKLHRLRTEWEEGRR